MRPVLYLLCIVALGCHADRDFGPKVAQQSDSPIATNWRQEQAVPEAPKTETKPEGMGGIEVSGSVKIWCGKILYRAKFGGGIAIDPACCCGGEEETCMDQQCYGFDVLDKPTLYVTITDANGNVWANCNNEELNGLGGAGDTLWYGSSGDGGDLYFECGVLSIYQFYQANDCFEGTVSCVVESNESPLSIRFRATIDNIAGCDLGDFNDYFYITVTDNPFP